MHGRRKTSERWRRSISRVCSERLIKSFQELSSLTAKSSEGTLRLKADLTRLTSELEVFKRSWERLGQSHRKQQPIAGKTVQGYGEKNR